MRTQAVNPGHRFCRVEDHAEGGEGAERSQSGHVTGQVEDHRVGNPSDVREAGGGPKVVAGLQETVHHDRKALQMEPVADGGIQFCGLGRAGNR
ncbi:hypothetical protein [Streptomyces sp. NPDC057889]|uniref:hypothetical protein n=1 Tax=unclassified Streptomyces TaxID=2593676 RepID=UPI0036BE0469